MSIRQTMAGIVDTARISFEAVIGSARGSLSPEYADKRLAWWGGKLVREAQMDLEVRGREHAGDGREPLVVVSNHQSLLDIPVLFHVMPGRLRMAAKAELFRVPVWGSAMRKTGFIRIDRRDPKRAVQALRSSGASLLTHGTRVWISPEGTRSATGCVGPFKTGAFHLAFECGVRILPVAIDGTRKALPRSSLSVRTGQHVTVTFLPPVDPKPFGEAHTKELAASVRSSIIAALDEAQAARPIAMPSPTLRDAHPLNSV